MVSPGDGYTLVYVRTVRERTKQRKAAFVASQPTKYSESYVP